MIFPGRRCPARAPRGVGEHLSAAARTEAAVLALAAAAVSAFGIAPPVVYFWCASRARQPRSQCTSFSGKVIPFSDVSENRS